ncbi:MULTISPECIES: LrgB family protein [unclassified Paenibacillus]|uniref:LrgB family protein n=1 Tax=unclassified Paenibacillus TaxID=185978 RepID=UPI0009551363|nr:MULTISPECIES: LrgB family protein [unclassified Paenibacillus]ASS64978.1 LrgB family protein [Paenibacillus sp. RUD330]SIQ52746.1 TIGR00659 family protein [Paenibacillus sp. RU4X]SIQ75110.1 TIGR00659 family protein [Paenibacillus sp. RU4T]
MSALAAAGFIFLTVLVYGGSKLAHRRWSILILSPLIVTPAAIMAILALCRIPYETYNEGGRWLSAMVGPATVALAVPLHKNAALLKKHSLEIAAGVAAGWMTGTAAALGICRLFHLDRMLADSLLLRATTTPIALAVSGMIGGISTLTAVFVLITGILGTVLGPLVISWTRIRSEVAQGVLMGSSAHTAGAHKAFELGAVPGSIASVSMLLSAFLSLFLIPLVAGFVA